MYRFLCLNYITILIVILLNLVLLINTKQISDDYLINNKVLQDNSNVENNVNDVDIIDDDDNLSMSLNDHVHLLSKQMNALMLRRREDYKLLENSLKKFVRKNSIQFMDTNVQTELTQLREEVKTLREAKTSNKERLTVQWLSQTISELRSELTELQESSNNISRDLQQKNQIFEDINGIRTDIQTIRLEMESLRSRQETTELLVKEVRDETLQNEENIRHNINKFNNQKPTISGSFDDIEQDADHKMRHHRFVRQEIHDLEMSQRALKRQLNEIQNHRIGDRLHNLEVEQRRLASGHFNLSRQVANLDKLHSSMLELLEDVEGIQNKVDKTIPDLRREISKLEYNSAQLQSNHNLIREDGHNTAKSLQAMAVSVSALQDYRDIMKVQQKQVDNLQKDVDKIKSVTNVHRDIMHSRIDKIENDSKTNSTLTTKINKNDVNDVGSIELQYANQLVKQLESVEMQYESIINKLPTDCSEVNSDTIISTTLNVNNSSTNQNDDGLYLIAPVGQHHPIMTRCDGEWTTIQRRHDGSVNFNRSWEQYSIGFGRPSGEFWIGNDVLHHLTINNCTKLKIIMEDIYDNIWQAEYNDFRVLSRENGYRLLINGYTGNASDALDYQNHMEFSAIDVDRDISNTNCAANYEGGWWFSHCQHANLNGRYNLGLTWFDSSRNEWIAVKTSHMMISQNKNCSSNLPQTDTLSPTLSTSSWTSSSSSSSSTIIAV